MTSATTPEMHEFWLKDYPTRGENKKWYRLALGELIPAEQRKIFPVGWKDPNYGNYTGSIGFMDVVIREEYIPKEGAVPLFVWTPPGYDPELYADCAWKDREQVRVLVLSVIGIEPQYQGNLSYLRAFKQRAEKLTEEWGLDILVADAIQNVPLRKALIREGFSLYDNGFRAVKRLKRKE